MNPFGHRARRSLSTGRVLCVLASMLIALPAAAVEPAYVEFNGQRYRVEKSITPDGSIKRYFDDAGNAYSLEQLRAHVAAQTPRIIQPSLAERLKTAAPTDMLDLVVVLRNQPASPIARGMWAAVQPQIDSLSEQIAAISRAALPQGSWTPAEEAALVPTPLAAPNVAARRALAQQLDDLTRDTRQQIYQAVAAAVQPDQDALAKDVAALGGTVTARIGIANILGVRMPASKVSALAAHGLVAMVDVDHPGRPELDVQKTGLGLTTGFWANGIDGGVQDVGVLDTGVQQSHPALSSHTFMSQNGLTTDPDGSSHGTGIAGIMASTNTTFTGMAFGCDKIIVAVAGTDMTSRVGMDFIAGTGEPENVNYSFGNGTVTIDYSLLEQFMDGVIDTLGYMVSKSAGNNGFGSGNPTLTYPGQAYNLMSSANMDDFNTTTRTDDRITSSSSRGPTIGNRKKPDITAPGTNSMTCEKLGGFHDLGGTSSASPHTGGGVVLLYDMGTTSVTTCKAILLNTTDAMNDNNTSSTADDVYVSGSLWNRRYGWGYLNLGAAYLHGLDAFTTTIDDAPANATYKFFVGQMFTNEKATLAWNRHVAFNGSAYPTQVENLSDLDLYAYQQSNNTLLASSTSAIDNVEQLSVNVDAVTVLKVKADGAFDPQVATETFGLATQENFVAANGPAFTVILTHAASEGPNVQFLVTADVENTGDLTAHNVTVTLSGPAVVVGANPAALGSIPAGQTAQAVWTVQAAAAPGVYPIDASVSSNSYGETFTGLGSSNYTVTSCMLGDVNQDGLVNGNDVSPFTLGLLSPGSLTPPQFCAADVQVSGMLDSADIPAFVALLVP